MRKFLNYLKLGAMSLSLVALIFVGVNDLGLTKAHADVQSLPYQKPSRGDADTMFTSTGAGYGINWQALVYETVKAVNWTAIQFSNNNVNWAQLYIGQ